MISLEIDVTINRPINEVFDRLADISGYNDWMSPAGLFIESRETSNGPSGPVTTFSDRTRIGRVEGEISEFRRPEKVRFRQTIYWLGIPAGESRPGYELESRNGKTIVHHKAEGNFLGFFRLLEPVLDPIFLRYAEAERKRTVQALKTSLETS